MSDIADMINPSIQGWINFYGKFYSFTLKKILSNINKFLFRWVKRKYRSLKHKRDTIKWICNVAARDIAVFVHWRYEARLAPSEVDKMSMNKKSRMMGDVTYGSVRDRLCKIVVYLIIKIVNYGCNKYCY